MTARPALAGVRRPFGPVDVPTIAANTPHGRGRHPHGRARSGGDARRDGGLSPPVRRASPPPRKSRGVPLSLSPWSDAAWRRSATRASSGVSGDTLGSSVGKRPTPAEPPARRSAGSGVQPPPRRPTRISPSRRAELRASASPRGRAQNRDRTTPTDAARNPGSAWPQPSSPKIRTGRATQASR